MQPATRSFGDDVEPPFNRPSPPEPDLVKDEYRRDERCESDDQDQGQHVVARLRRRTEALTYEQFELGGGGRRLRCLCSMVHAPYNEARKEPA